MKRSVQLKSILIISCCLLTAGCLFAQQQQTSNENSMTTKFGIKGGVNLSNLYIDQVQRENMKVGVNAGFFVKVPLVQGLSIQPELLYTRKGAKDSYGGTSSVLGSGEYRFNLNYLETPLLMVFNLTKNLNLSAGGYAAYLLSANVKDVNNDGTITGVTNLNADNFHRFDYGLVGGVGVDIQKMTLGARYNYGMQNIGQPGSLSGNLTSNSKNSVFTFFIGFAL